MLHSLLVPLAVALAAAQPTAQLAPRSQHVVALVEDGLARVTVRETYALDAPLETALRLPASAALVGVALERGGGRVEGELVERDAAGALELPAGESVLELVWIEPVPLVGGERRFACALRGASASAEVTLRSAVALLDVAASHERAHVVRQGEHEAIVTFEGAPEGELVVTSSVRAQEPRLDVRTFRAAPGEDAWFVATLTAGDAMLGGVAPRDVILALDASRATQGERIERQQRAALLLLDDLLPQDRISVLRVASRIKSFAAEPVEATSEAREEVAQYVRDTEAQGRYAFVEALEALSELPEAPGRARAALLVVAETPALDDAERARAIELARAAGDAGVRIAALGLGEEADAELLHAVAAASGGRADSVSALESIEPRIAALLARSALVVLPRAELRVEGLEAYDVLPATPADARLGEQLVFTGRLRGAGAATFTVGGLRAATDVGREPSGSELVRLACGLERKAALERALALRERLGDAYAAALADGFPASAERVSHELVATSLAHGVGSMRTSFALEAGGAGAAFVAAVAAVAPSAGSGAADEPAAQGQYGSRRGGPNALRGAGADVRRVVADGTRWLAGRLAEGGADAGAEALGLLVLLEQGGSPVAGPHHELIAESLRRLCALQDRATGAFGDRASPTFLRDQALATRVLAIVAFRVGSPLARHCGEAASACLVRALEQGWPAPGAGLGEVVEGLVFAREAGFAVPDRAFDAAAEHVLRLVEPVTGAARTDGATADHPCVVRAAHTAELVWARLMIAIARWEDPPQPPLELLEPSVDFVAAALESVGSEPACDPHFWLWGGHVMRRAGGSRWRVFERALWAAMAASGAPPWEAGPHHAAAAALEASALWLLAAQVYLE